MTKKRTGHAQKRPKARLAGTALFGLAVATLTVIFSTQILYQAWHEPPSTVPECRKGLRVLVESLYRARQSAAGADGELQAIDEFRSELAPDWDVRAGVARACAEDPPATELLKTLQQLRYAEEQAVRYEARELAAERRHVEQLAGKLLGLY